MKRTLIIPICLLLLTGLYGQEDDFSSRFYQSYETYKEPALDKRRIKHAQLQPLIDRFKALDGFEVRKVGSSIEGRDLSPRCTGMSQRPPRPYLISLTSLPQMTSLGKNKLSWILSACIFCPCSTRMGLSCFAGGIPLG